MDQQFSIIYHYSSRRKYLIAWKKTRILHIPLLTMNFAHLARSLEPLVAPPANVWWSCTPAGGSQPFCQWQPLLCHWENSRIVWSRQQSTCVESEGNNIWNITKIISWFWSVFEDGSLFFFTWSWDWNWVEIF